MEIGTSDVKLEKCEILICYIHKSNLAPLYADLPADIMVCIPRH